MKYKGEVTLSLITSSGKKILITKHNRAEVGLQLAFANMLSGIDTKNWVPSYVIYNSNMYEITGRNKRIDGTITDADLYDPNKGPRYYVEFNAFIPVPENGSVTTMLDKSQRYIVVGRNYINDKSNIYTLASISSGMEPEEIQAVTANLQGNDQAGLQININWKMYLEMVGD